MDCSICLEPIQEEQPKKILDSCHHEFHEACLNPWLQTHVTCPNCRGAVPNAQTTVEQQQRERELRELDRLYLTFVLFNWILGAFSGIEFRRHFREIHWFLSHLHWNTLRPISFTMTPRNQMSLSSIKTLRGCCIGREQALFSQLYPEEVHPSIHRNPRTLQIYQELKPHLVEFVQNLS